MNEKLTKIEEDVVWVLLERNAVCFNIAVTSNEKLRKKYDLFDIESAWKNLIKKDFVEGKANGGGFGSVSASRYKKAKKYFRYKFWFLERVWKPIRKIWIFLLKHLITIIVATIISVITTVLSQLLQ